MSAGLIGGLGILTLLVLLFLGVHIAVALWVVGIVGMVLFLGPYGAVGMLRMGAYSIVEGYTWSVIPLFLLMGMFSYHGGLTTALYNAAYKWFGRLPGGLVLVTIGAAGAFSAASGSSTAMASIFTKISLPEMLKYNYDKRLAAGSIAAAGTLDILIPPSITFVIYGIFTEQPIGQLLMAGVLPGIVLVLLYLGVVLTICRWKPNMAPKMEERISWGERISSLRGCWTLPLLAFVVMGGIYFGIFTSTEAGAVGALAALIIALAARRLSRGSFMNALRETASTTAMMFLIIIGAIIFSRFVALTQLTPRASDFLLGLGVSRVWILAGFIVIYVILGMLMDLVGMMAITLPVFLPILISLGYDPIWFGVVIVVVCEIGLITPPVGLNVFVVKAVAGDLVSMEDIFRGTLPFFFMDLVLVVILIAWPDLALFLPSRMEGG